MATVELGPRSPRGARTGTRRTTPWPLLDPGAGSASALLGAALLVVLVYAVFAHGTTASPAEPRVEVAVCLLGVCATVGLLGTGRLQLRLSRSALAGVVLLAGFAGWTGVSLAWSVAPDLTWVEFNRTILYVVVLLLATTFGSSGAHPMQRTVAGLGALVGLAVVYALLQKILPGVRIGGLVDLDQTGVVARLQEPIGYWNALALLFAMGAPLALATAAATRVAPRLRVLALVGLQLTVVAGAFTVSRGGIVAFAVALLATVLLAGERLRVLMWAACALLAALPVVVIGLLSRALSGDGVPLARRETAGLLLALLLVATGTLLVLGAGRLMRLERTVVIDEPRRRRIEQGLLGAILGALFLGLLVIIASHRGLTGSISHAWHSFTSTKPVSNSSPSRLLSDASGNRFTWWKEALAALSDRPLTGWGAGSFPVVHLLFRHNAINVDHAHSALFEWLAEDGLFGTLVVLAGWALLVTAAVRTVLRRAGLERLWAAALTAAALAYSVHALVDWDWDIPGVTLPVLVALGVVAGSSFRVGSPAPDRAQAPDRARTADRALIPLLTPAVVSARLGRLGLVAGALCVLAVSAVLPSIAAGRASAAEVAAADPTMASLRRAAEDASLATDLDPLSDAGPRAAADVALRRGDVTLARALFIEAVGREPTDAVAWSDLAATDVVTHRLAEAVQAEHRATEDDPVNVAYARALAAYLNLETLGATPPADSVTAVATPPSP